MKSNIPWSSPCMRRFGTSIREQIQEVANQVVLGSFRAQLYAKQHVITKDTFMVPGLMGRA
jgi:hypothetical protein